jgi:hypothetical protein
MGQIRKKELKPLWLSLFLGYSAPQGLFETCQQFETF